MTRHPDLTSVFCLADEPALDALDRAPALAIRVTHDVSVIDVNDIHRAEAAGLTTVEQPLQAEGAVAGRVPIPRIDQGLSRAGPRVAKLLPSTLYVRTSTSPV